MFDAIEDIPMNVLMAELKRRWPDVKMRYLVWNDRDPNDNFEVEAVSAEEASWAALDELGWCVSAEPLDWPEDTDYDSEEKLMSKEHLITELTELAEELDKEENMDPYWVKYQGPVVRKAITALQQNKNV